MPDVTFTPHISKELLTFSKSNAFCNTVRCNNLGKFYHNIKILMLDSFDLFSKR